MTETTIDSPNGTATAEVLPPASLDLDSLEREGKRPEPFTFIHLGNRYTLLDPKEIDWKKLISALTNPYLFFEVTLDQSKHEQFLESDLPAWKLNKLIDSYIEHYGLPPLGESAALPR